MIADWLISLTRKRPPDFVIGGEENPYLRRWWLIPRNRFFNIYVHEILRSDDDRALHTHPWVNVSWILRGWYFEVVPRFSDQPSSDDYERAGLMRIFRGCGDVVARFATDRHRLEVNGPTWSLFVRGPVIREWFFHCAKGPVVWHEFVDSRNRGAIGRGCGD